MKVRIRIGKKNDDRVEVRSGCFRLKSKNGAYYSMQFPTKDGVRFGGGKTTKSNPKQKGENK